MGYTHYWHGTITKTQSLEWIASTNKLMIIYNQKHATEESHKIVNCGQQTLTLKDDEVLINGIEPFDCEVYGFQAGTHYDDFCKTRRHPYDAVVCASLILGSYLTDGKLVVSSDGGFSDEEVFDAINLARDTFPQYNLARTIHNIFKRD